MFPKSTRQGAIANNLANVEVPGFKKDNLFMREAMKKTVGRLSRLADKSL
jgi:flagellar basal body rod protein FlgB